MKVSKNTLIAALALVVLGLFALFARQSKVALHNKLKADALEKTVSNTGRKAKVTEIRLNDSITAMQAETEDLKITLENLRSKYNNLLAAAKTRPKDVDKIVEVKTTTHSVDTVICKVDSFGGLTARLEDGYADIKVNIDSCRNAAIDYTVNDSITIINYTKRHSLLFGLIKWNSYQGSKVITHNPKATPVIAVAYSVIDNEK